MALVSVGCLLLVLVMWKLWFPGAAVAAPNAPSRARLRSVVAGTRVVCLILEDSDGRGSCAVGVTVDGEEPAGYEEFRDAPVIW